VAPAIGVTLAAVRLRLDAATKPTVTVRPDFEWFPAFPGIVEGGGYRGREGVKTYYREIDETWEEYRVFGDEFRDLGESVLLLGRLEGRGKGGGVPVTSPMGMIFDFRDGKCWRHRVYLDHDEALRATGLSE
jgi:ketosteroid isomerase-like protein